MNILLEAVLGRTSAEALHKLSSGRLQPEDLHNNMIETAIRIIKT